MKRFFIIFLLVLLGCMNIKQEGAKNIRSSALNFFKSKKYSLATRKSDIPIIVIDSISRINNETFKIGDNSDVGKINFSDAYIDVSEYKRKLNFVLVNDTFCLITYAEGGLGTHDVIDYMQYKGTFNHARYITTDVLSDTIKLGNYLRGDPKPIITK